MLECTDTRFLQDLVINGDGQVSHGWTSFTQDQCSTGHLPVQALGQQESRLRARRVQEAFKRLWGQVLQSHIPPETS